ncbi:uncharacterized protein LOC124151746 [Haliotis rufescens]|uniref:uncharacterized protein LOC124151746 n=1 Tax=Haliotis rufescens TaxID=6454 RepID=UPI001EB0A634|nr:uncharacterized protein LOC124151746 [Haliotis rufescens]XP_046380319.1 uncharacterized protein LOC124151746 [Haliotis rufescens]
MKSHIATVVIVSFFSVSASQVVSAALSGKNCSKTADCGWKSTCNTTSSQCYCTSGYVLHSSGKDCLNKSCSGVKDCVECSSADVCMRCVSFILKDTRSCVSVCKGKAEISEEGPFLGNVCTESNDTKDIIIPIVAGVAAAVLLCFIITLAVCCHLRKTRRNVNLQEKNYKSRELEMGKVKQFPVYDNKGFESESQLSVRQNVINSDVYLQQLEELRPHTETLMMVLSQIRRKLRSMDQSDPRVPTYKGVIHQLCRVLVLLHKKDPTVSIPSDALGLIEWAQQMLEDHREQDDEEQNVSAEPMEGPISRISYIDVDLEHMNSPVYATPVGKDQPGHPLSSSNTSGYYSSVPVPLPEMNNIGYATINRTPTNPTLYSSNKNVLSKPGSVQKVNNVKSRSRVVTNAGYFANGRYYDPSPQPVVYAPASSYSDRSAGPLSTFTGDFHRSRSFSGSDNNSNSDGDNEDDDKLSDLDPFPFDPRDATDPVEV